MPKYYVHDGVEKTIIESDSPLQACFRSIQYRFQGIPVNGFYKVSEQGFENHEDDTIFSSDEVIQAFVDMMEKSPTKPKRTKRVRKKKRKKDEDGD